MNIKQTLTRAHSRPTTLKIVKYIGDDPARFNQLVETFLSGPYPITQRAAWPLSVCVEKTPALIKPHLGKILRYVTKPGVHDAVKRNTLRLLQFIKIPARQQGKVAGICFKFLQDRSEPIAVRVFAMTVLGQLAIEEPDLRNELKSIIEEELPYARPAFTSGSKKVLRWLQANPPTNSYLV